MEQNLLREQKSVVKLITIVFFFSSCNLILGSRSGKEYYDKKVSTSNERQEFIKITIRDYFSRQKLKHADIYLNNNSYLPDSTGLFKLPISKSKLRIWARCIGYESSYIEIKNKHLVDAELHIYLKYYMPSNNPPFH